MSTDNIQKKIEPFRDAFRIAAIAKDDPDFMFPCLIKLSDPNAQLPPGVNWNSSFGQFRTGDLTFEQLNQVADCPEVLSFTIR